MRGTGEEHCPAHPHGELAVRSSTLNSVGEPQLGLPKTKKSLVQARENPTTTTTKNAEHMACKARRTTTLLCGRNLWGIFKFVGQKGGTNVCLEDQSTLFDREMMQIQNRDSVGWTSGLFPARSRQDLHTMAQNLHAITVGPPTTAPQANENGEKLKTKPYDVHGGCNATGSSH